MKKVGQEKQKNNFTKLTHKRGISLIVLIVTIIVIIILAAAVILTITKNNPVESAKESTFKEDVRTFQDDLAMTVAKEYTEKQGQRDKKISTSKYDEIKQYIPSFTEKYKDKFVIVEDQLVGTDKLKDKEKEWVNDVNINIVESEETNYTSEEIENSEYLYAIGKTKPEYVVAKFNDDYSEVVITKNGEDSDGVIAEFAVWTSNSPMTNKKDTLKKAVVKEGIVDLGDGGGGIGTFSSCINLESVLLPESLVKIGQNAFAYCKKLVDITIPNNVTKLENNAFVSCINLKSIVIPKNITSIGSASFFGCSGLTNVIIQDGVKSISYALFRECSNLTTIYIPYSVYSIGSEAFNNCSNLSNITYNGTREQWNSITKDENWKINSSIKTIKCSDGDITL